MRDQMRWGAARVGAHAEPPLQIRGLLALHRLLLAPKDILRGEEGPLWGRSSSPSAADSSVAAVGDRRTNETAPNSSSSATSYPCGVGGDGQRVPAGAQEAVALHFLQLLLPLIVRPVADGAQIRQNVKRRRGRRVLLCEGRRGVRLEAAADAATGRGGRRKWRGNAVLLLLVLVAVSQTARSSSRCIL